MVSIDAKANNRCQKWTQENRTNSKTLSPGQPNKRGPEVHFMVWKSDIGHESKRWAVVKEPASAVCCRYGTMGRSHSSDFQFGTDSWWLQIFPHSFTSNLWRGSVRKKQKPTQIYIHTRLLVVHSFYLTWKLKTEVVELLLIPMKHHNKPCGRLCGWKLEPWCKMTGTWWIGKRENSWKMLLQGKTVLNTSEQDVPKGG